MATETLEGTKMNYHPDSWVVLRFNDPNNTTETGEFYKILAGWKGGFADSDYWRLNSGIQQIEKKDSVYTVTGYSGSVYFVNEHQERLSLLTSEIYHQLKFNRAEIKYTVEIVPIESILTKFKRN